MTPEFDEDGYPTEKTLDIIQQWDYRDLTGLIDYVEAAWRYPEYCKIENNIWSISTGGWSGNESIISALQMNLLFWGICWLQSRRGGHYQFTIH